jgi:hypothetical protein
MVTDDPRKWYAIVAAAEKYGVLDAYTRRISGVENESIPLRLARHGGGRC